MLYEVITMFEGEPTLSDRVREELERSDLRTKDETRYRLVKALLNVYGGEPSRYINFYGPPGTIPTVHYDQALQIGTENGPAVDVKGKAIFVGLSEVLLAERKDSFYTVFSQANRITSYNVCYTKLLRPNAILNAMRIVFQHLNNFVAELATGFRSYNFV